MDERLSATTGTTGTIGTAAADGEGDGEAERLQRRSLRVLLASRLSSVPTSPRA